MREKNIAASSGESASPSPKKSKKKLGIVAGILAAVFVVTGAGLWVWHEQPSFCGAICHTPMDPYLATYEQESGVPGLDKWGNEVEDTDAMLAVSHRTLAGSECLDCHIPVMSQQISEGVAWVSGNYEVVPNDTYGLIIGERNLDELASVSGSDPESICLNEACHADSSGEAIDWEDLAKLTASEYGERNPHSNEHGNSTCSDCHKAHRASVMHCTECHGDAKVPDGWLSTAEAKKLGNVA